MQIPFKLISLSHETAPLEIREKVELSEEEKKVLSLRFKEIYNLDEILIVSTCNRTEIYFSSEIDNCKPLIDEILQLKKIKNSDDIYPYFKTIQGNLGAEKHLFQVATGLKSKVVGDLQIPNQIKRSYQISADLGLAGPYLHRLMHTIFYANKRVTQETSFRDGAASVSYATVALAEEISQSILEPKVLILGLGEIGTDVCKNMADRDFAEITIMNRTLEKAEKIAKGTEFKVAKMEDLFHEIDQADIVISSIRTEEPIITKENMKDLNLVKFKYFIDLSVPRSIESGIEKIDGLLLYNIDSIKQKADRALQERIASIPHVESIIEDSLEGFKEWSKEMELSPTIHKLKESLEQIRKEELNRYVKELSPKELAKLEKITSNLVQKIIKQPIVNLKAACKRGESENLVDLLNELFNLEKVKSEE
ncbi:MAG: Glutamyl-tRNA reductase [Bacteroidota bacterium]|jgi:glutamyl-tRNA reductase